MDYSRSGSIKTEADLQAAQDQWRAAGMPMSGQLYDSLMLVSLDRNDAIKTGKPDPYTGEMHTGLTPRGNAGVQAQNHPPPTPPPALPPTTPPPPPPDPATGNTAPVDTGINTAANLPPPTPKQDLRSQVFGGQGTQDSEHKVTVEVKAPEQTPTGSISSNMISNPNQSQMTWGGQSSFGLNSAQKLQPYQDQLMQQPIYQKTPMPPTQQTGGINAQITPGQNVQGQAGMPPPIPPTGPTSPTRPSGAMNPGPGQFSPFGNNPQPVPGPARPNLGMGELQNGTAQQAGQTGQWNGFDPTEKNTYGPQQIAGSRPDQADYGSVQQYADDALANANRYLDPQMAQQDRRLQQEMINKGIDPNSPQGQEMQKMKGMQQADARNAAAFNSLGFGQGIQNQMAQQDLSRSGIAANMQQALWNAQLGASGQDLQRYGIDQQTGLANAQMGNQMQIANMQNALQGQLGMAGLQNQRYGMDTQRYGMDIQNQLGMGQLDMARQGQDFNQMMGLEGMDFRNNQFNFGQQQYQDQLMMALMGMTPIPGVSPISPGGAYNAGLGSAGQDRGILGTLLG